MNFNYEQGKIYDNSIGMKMIQIMPGSFVMGDDEGDPDESPRHMVRISKPFYMSGYEVTNSQYEEFDPSHKEMRGKLGFSKDDNDAAVFVSWNDAFSFCQWLSEKEGLPYRLPTEAEWEYAARAGTKTAYSMGDELPEVYYKNQRESWYPDPSRSGPEDIVSLQVGQNQPNPWGLYDMNGNVEEWCFDWYGSYVSQDQIDPVGYSDGEFRVTRGGSHSTPVYYLRSSNRSGTIPEDKSWFIGFRIVCGELPETKPIEALEQEKYQINVSQDIQKDLNNESILEKLYFRGPRRYVKIENDSKGLFIQHNHCPALVECPNGDLLSIWFSCKSETGREMLIAASRRPYGDEEWQEASVFWNPPDRNTTGSALTVDNQGTVYHFNGLGAASTFGNLVLIMRTSKDNGVTWSKPQIIDAEHGLRNMPIASAFINSRDEIILPCDAATVNKGGTALHIGSNLGSCWEEADGTIMGIHATVVELNDGGLLAFGRGVSIDGKMPKSISYDKGKTWTYATSEFPPICIESSIEKYPGGQRTIMIRLKEGPLFFASFANEMAFKDASGTEYLGSGLFGAVSFDEGVTWPVKRLITNDSSSERILNGGAWTGEFTLSRNTAEPKGYLTAIQARKGIIHLISSGLHYEFNLMWLMTLPPEIVTSNLMECSHE